MKKLPMCRVCLVENVRMYVVANKSLQKLYEKLTGVPFVTEDNRPMLACYFCCTKLKQCWRFQRKCLEAEELFTQMLKEDYKLSPLRNGSQWQFCGGFVKTPIQNINVDQIEGVAIKEEPADCERLYIEPKEELLSDGDLSDVKQENEDNSGVDGIPLHYSELHLEYDEPIEGPTKAEEEQEVIKRKRTAKKKTRAPVGETKKPKLEVRRSKLEDKTTEEQTSKDNRNIKKCTSETVTDFKTPYTVKKLQMNNSVNNTYVDNNCSINSNNDDNTCEISNDKDDVNERRRLCVKKKRFKCDICLRSFSTKFYLKCHIGAHNGERPYKCEVCQCSFNQKNNLTDHIRVHTGEKPYKCDVCQNSFTRKHYLTYHLRTHTGEKPYKCDICQRSFAQKVHLSTHIRIHTGEKPYKCNVCQRGFNVKAQLTVHIRTHTGEKPFKCGICQCSFGQKGGLSTHIRKRH